MLGDLLNEDEVLRWLIEQKNTATIEEVTDEILEDLIEEYEYVVVYFSKYNLLLNVVT
jgi:dihydroneopterin aldolase